MTLTYNNNHDAAQLPQLLHTHWGTRLSTGSIRCKGLRRFVPRPQSCFACELFNKEFSLSVDSRLFTAPQRVGAVANCEVKEMRSMEQLCPRCSINMRNSCVLAGERERERVK